MDEYRTIVERTGTRVNKREGQWRGGHGKKGNMYSRSHCERDMRRTGWG